MTTYGDKAGGPPSTYTPEIAERFCQHVSEGNNAIDAAEVVGKAAATIWRWFEKYPEFGEMYARAREIRAERAVREMVQTIEDVRSGKLDANAARVMLDTHKWLVSKWYPRTYGDQKTVTLETGANFTSLLEQLDKPTLIEGTAEDVTD